MAFTICCTLTFSFFIAPFIVRLCWHQCGITVLQSGKKNKTVAYCAVENVRGGSSGVNARAASLVLTRQHGLSSLPHFGVQLY